MGKIAKNIPIYIEVRSKSIMRSAKMGSIKTHKKSHRAHERAAIVNLAEQRSFPMVTLF